MTPSRRYAKQQTKAINRRRLNARERHQRQQRQAQRGIDALHQALDDLAPLWRHVESMSPATKRRWQWTWVWDDSVFRKYGQAFELVGTWYRGQHKRVVCGIDGVLMIVVIGDGKLVVPVDFAVRRPAPKGPGARCRNKLEWAQVMFDQSQVALLRRGLRLPAPLAAADSWLSDSKLLRHVSNRHQGTLLVQGKSTYTFTLEDGQKVKGADLINGDQWPWRQSLQAPGCRYARLRAHSATYGEVTLILVDRIAFTYRAKVELRERKEQTSLSACDMRHNAHRKR